MKSPVPTPRPLLDGPALEEITDKKALIREWEGSGLNLGEFLAGRGLKRTTFYRMRRRLREGGSLRLLDARADNPGRPTTMPAWAQGWVFAYLANFPKATLKAAAEAVAGAAATRNLRPSTYKQVLRLWRRTPPDVRKFLAEGSRVHFEEHGIVRRKEGFRSNSRWELDSTELDCYVLCLETGRLFRPHLVCAIDCASRAIMGSALLRSAPTAADTLALLRRAVLPKGTAGNPFYGRPGEVQTDGGKCFRCPEVLDALDVLGMTYVPTPVRKPGAQGKVERLMGTIKRQWLATLAGYAAQHRGLAKAEEAAIPWPVFGRLWEKFQARYHVGEHAALQTSPYEWWLENVGGAEGLTFNPADVRAALKVRREYTLERDGVRLEDGRHYHSPKLAGFVGRRIVLRVDPEGVGAGGTVDAYCDGEFIDHLRCQEDDPALHPQLDAARLARTDELREFRRRLRGILRHAPALRTPAVRHGTAASPGARRAVKDQSAAPADIPRFEGHLRDDEGGPIVVLTPEPERAEAPPTVPAPEPGRDA